MHWLENLFNIFNVKIYVNTLKHKYDIVEPSLKNGDEDFATLFALWIL